MTGQMNFHSARTVLLGHTASGKSVLQRALRMGPGPAPNVNQQHEATSYLDIQTLLVGDGMKQKTVDIWDLAGAPEYAATAPEKRLSSHAVENVGMQCTHAALVCDVE